MTLREEWVEYEACGRGICAANAGHEGSCAAASGWGDVSLNCDVGRHGDCDWEYPIDCKCWHHNPAVQKYLKPEHTQPTDPAWPCRHCGSRDHNTGWHDHTRTHPSEPESPHDNGPPDITDDNFGLV